MSTPQEKRFAALAVARGALRHGQVNRVAHYQHLHERGGNPMPLWQCAVLCELLDRDTAEELWAEAGELDIEYLGRYHLARKMGDVRRSNVWLAVMPEGRRSVVKILPPGPAISDAARRWFMQRAGACCRIEDDHMARAYSAGKEEGYCYLAMEYVPGLSVAQEMRRSGALSVQESTLIVRQAAEALCHAHERGVVHGDIRPANIKLGADGSVRLVGMGPDIMGREDRVPLYTAPEHIRDAMTYDSRSDVYSLGACWYHMVTGGPPFEASTRQELLAKIERGSPAPVGARRPGVPQGVAQTIERMLTRLPGMRIQTGGQLCRIMEARCAARQGVVDELALPETGVQGSAWEMKLQINGRTEKRRLRLEDVRERYERGQITRETPTRRVGYHDAYRPAQEFSELDREVFSRYEAGKTPSRAPRGTAPRAHGPHSHAPPHRPASRRRQESKPVKRWLRRVHNWMST